MKCSNPILPSTAEGIATEIKVRRKINDGRTVRVPKVLHSCVGRDRSYLVDQLLFEARMFDPLRDCPRLAQGLFEFYLKNGMVQRSLADVVPGDLFTPIKRLFSSFGHDSSALLRFANRTVLNQDVSQVGVPFGLSHGDMSVGNLLVQDDVIYIVDWERADEAPVFADLSKLFSQIPGLQKELLPLFRQWSQSQPLKSLKEKDDIILGRVIQLTYLLKRHEAIVDTPEGAVAKSWLWKTLSARTKVLADDLSAFA